VRRREAEVIAIRLPDATAAARLIDALLVTGGAVPVPADPADRAVYLALAHQLGDGLDALPAPTTATADAADTRSAA
jgi:hypothetical protein